MMTSPKTSHHRLRRRSLCLLMMALQAWSSSGAAEPTSLQAGTIESDTQEAVRVRGSDAIAGIGDWYLSNGTVCAAVLGAQHHGQLIPGGGTLVDLGHCGRGDDQFIGLEPLFNLNRDEMFPVLRVEAVVEQDRAQIVTHAREGGLVLTTRYVLDTEEPSRLEIHSQVHREAPGPRFFGMADILIHTESALRNFVLNDAGRYSGFRHVSREGSGYLEIASSIRTAAGVVLVGSDDQGPPVAYLYRPTSSTAIRPPQSPAHLATFTLAFNSVTITNLATQPLWFPSQTPGVLQLLQLPWMDLPLGESIEFRRELRLSQRADVASLADRVYSQPLRPTPPIHVSGKVDDPGARVHVFRAGDGATSHITMARPDLSGRFSFRVPRGRYRFEILTPDGQRVVEQVDLVKADDDFSLGTIPLAAAARVTLPRDAPMRLVFRGIDDTPDPIFGDDLSGLTIDGRPKRNSVATSYIHLSGTRNDPSEVQLAPGRYRVYATRGPEFSLTHSTLSVSGGERAVLEIAAPTRVLETAGWIGADFHVHAAPSFDSTLPQRLRLRSFVAEGGEVLVATDHDVVSEYTSLIDELELGDELTTLSGLEVTTISPTPRNPHTTGHINIYPVPYRPERNRGGAFQDEGLRLREIIALARDLPDRPIVQLNHPRHADEDLYDEAFLDHLSVAAAPFDPDRPLDAPPNRFLLETDSETGTRDIDFDAIELLNGSRTNEYRLIQRDWFAFLSQGHRLTGMANSDTHSLSAVASVPRNYVRLAQDDVAHFDAAEFLAAARRGHVFSTTGPLLDVALGTAGPGDQHTGARARLTVTVRSAPWVPVSNLRIYRNGRLDHEFAIDGPVEKSLEMEFDKDSYIVVEVEGPVAEPYAAVLPGFTPLAYTNPIYVDADKDGRWTAPGLATH